MLDSIWKTNAKTTRFADVNFQFRIFVIFHFMISQFVIFRSVRAQSYPGHVAPGRQYVDSLHGPRPRFPSYGARARNPPTKSGHETAPPLSVRRQKRTRRTETRRGSLPSQCLKVCTEKKLKTQILRTKLYRWKSYQIMRHRLCMDY